MKKFMKVIKAFSHNVGKIIDKKIITPVTKLIVVVTSKFDKSGKKLENWLSKTNTLLFISLVLAIGIFILIDQKIIVFTDSNAEVLQDRKVTAIYNTESYVVEGLPETVDITLIGSKTDLYIAKQSTAHDVSIDLSGLGVGTHKVSVDYNQNAGNIRYTVNPSSVTVVIYPKVSKTFTLSVDTLNKDSLDATLSVDKIAYDTDKVVIKGAEHQLEEVAEVKALVDLENLVSQEKGTSTIKDVPLKAYNKEGNALNVEIVPSKIDVDVTLSAPSKNVPIEVIPKGDVSFGYGIESMAPSVSNVTVYGDSKTLEGLTSIPVEINVSDLKEDKTFKAEIIKPVGVKSVSVNNLTVKVTLAKSTSSKFSDISIISKNLAEGYTVQGVDENSTKVDVTVKGVKNVIDLIKDKYTEYIYPYIDLSGYTDGEYEVNVQIDGKENRLQYTPSPKKVKIKIVKK